MPEAPVWITEKDVGSFIDLKDAVKALERVLPMEVNGSAKNMVKAHLMVADNDAMHALGASIVEKNLCGFKTWVNVRGKSETIVSLFSLGDGSLKAVIEATALGQLRTAAMTAVGTRYLAPTDADEMAIIGTGKQALPQIAACNLVRPLKKLRIFSRAEKNRELLAEIVKNNFDFEVSCSETLQEAIEDTPLITLITNSTEPFLTADLVKPGCHINAMGAIFPRRVEFTKDLFLRCSVIAVDNIINVQNTSAEFRDFFGTNLSNWSRVTTVGQIISDNFKRPSEADLTLFKATGMGLSDLAIAIDVYDRLCKSDGVQLLPRRFKIPPSLE